MKFAFFDVDNTIYNGYTANDLFEYLKEDKRVVDIYKRYTKTIEDYQSRVIDYNTACLLILDYFSDSLAGYDYEVISKIVKRMLTDKNKVLNDWVQPVIKFLKSKNFKIILVSGGPDTVVSEVAKIAKADEFFATEIKRNGFKYSGEKTELLNDKKKSDLVENILNTGEKNTSLGFGDSTGDIPMLELTDHAFVVENDHHKEMLDYATKNGWHIFKNTADILGILEKLDI